MLHQVFEFSRKATEASSEMQQALLNLLRQDWFSSAPMNAGLMTDWTGSLRQRWVDLTVETLHKQRESLDTMFRAAIEMFEESSGGTSAKAEPDGSARASERMWRGFFDALKLHTEAQFKEFRDWAERSFETARHDAASEGRSEEHATRQ